MFKSLYRIGGTGENQTFRGERIQSGYVTGARVSISISSNAESVRGNAANERHSGLQN